MKKVGGGEVLFWTANDAPAHLDRDSHVFFNLLNNYPNAVFIFDTLRSSQSGDENDSRSMAFVLQTLRKLRDCGATVILLHHTKKGSDSTYKGSTTIFDLVDHVIGLYPVNGPSSEQDFGENHIETSKQVFHFGTKDKTRFQPFKLHLRFDVEQGLFTLATEPPNLTLERIRELIPHEGIIQKDLLPIISQQLKIGEKKIHALLKQGTGFHWTAKKILNETIRSCTNRFSVSQALRRYQTKKPTDTGKRTMWCTNIASLMDTALQFCQTGRAKLQKLGYSKVKNKVLRRTQYDSR